jgi:4-diphosphocytidyl-2-C-methyl-D-erythritol kinase
MQRNAYAKINWDLLVLGRRPDGFHALDSVMVNVGLHDVLTFEPADALRLTCSDPSLPCDERNLVFKAALVLARESRHGGGAHIHLEKRIPAGGGMGGGSSDGACALRGLNALWGLNWPVEQLHPLAAELGSDVAFFLYGGWRQCLGRGEIVRPLAGSEQWPAVPILLVMPPLHVPTPAVYKALRANAYDGASGRDAAQLAQAIAGVLKKLRGNPSGSGLDLRNELTNASREVEPRLGAVQEVLQAQYPGRWLMSGSGAVHFVVASPDDDGSRLSAALAEKAGPGIRVLATTTVQPL